MVIRLQIRRSVPLHWESLNEMETDKVAAGTNTSFAATLALYNELQLHSLTTFYWDRLAQAIEEGVGDISSWLRHKKYFSPHEHKTLTELTRIGQKRRSSKLLLNLVTEKDSRARRMMWVFFEEMRPILPKLNKIMTEIQEQGATLVKVVSSGQIVPHVPSELTAVQRLHKETLQRQSERLEVKNILINENVRTFQLVDHFTELTIVSDLRDLELVEHELLARGRDHEECRQKQPRRELQKIRTDKLFHSSFSGGSHLPSSQGSGSDSPTGTSAVVSGVAGIGKTTLVQKIVHDWATGKIYPHFHFVFVFKFRDLNRFHDRTTLSRLIVEQYPYLSDVLDELWKHPETLLFIFDGLDEFRATIDFGDNQSDTDPQRSCTDPKFYFKVSDIVRSLIQQKLLPGCSVLVTSRPTATHLLAKAQVSVWAEILGFVGEERKEYFHKFFEDQGMAAAVYSHVEENELLLTMCYNPSYCWILALTLGPFFTLKQSNKHPVPKTVTQLFSHYIYHILTHHSVKIENLRDVILKIGNMAFTGVSHRNIIFNTEDLIKYDLQLSQFLSSFLMEIVERESSERSVVYTFPHLSIQEFAAALAQFLSPHPRTIRKCLARADRAKNGRFEIFLRFVAGLTSSRAAQPLEEFLGPLAHHTTSAVIDWLKEKFKAQIRDTDTVHGKRKLLNTLHYLFESQNQALVQLTLGSVQTLTFGGSSPKKALRLTPIDCVVVSQAIGLCDTLNLLDLSRCYIQVESLHRLVPALHKCQQLLLRYNKLGVSGMIPLCEALTKPESKIQRLDLGHNHLGDSGMKRLCEALRNKECKIKNLELASNQLRDSGLKPLCDALRNPECKIQRLVLEDNKLTADCTEELASALKTNRSLTELHLSHNNVGDSGVKRLCEALRNPECKIQSMGLWCNNLSDGCTNDLVSALSTSRSLRKLFLEYNSFTDISIPALRRLTLTCTSLEEIRLEGNEFSSDGENQLQSLRGIRAELSVTV
eukprot:gi/632983359/ref/XP_007908608.1/ PREDICTED: NACHT, LRR and PYD domains-containing protein 1-like isoform X3 [Callorhinchus milii]